jgi:Ca2+/H+ antiporter, TMEM165/GDT1 family
MSQTLPPEQTVTEPAQVNLGAIATVELQNSASLAHESIENNGIGNNSIENNVENNTACETKGFWGCFLSTFLTIFLAELGDKTQVTTLLMSAQSHAPWLVFLGAASALITTSLIGVLLGQWLAQRVSARTLDTLAAILLILITIGLVSDVMAA